MNWIAVCRALRERASTIKDASSKMSADNPAKIAATSTELTLNCLAEALEIGTRTPQQEKLTTAQQNKLIEDAPETDLQRMARERVG